MPDTLWLFAGAVALLIVLASPRYGVVASLLRWAAFRRKVWFEHALKHLVDPEHHGGGRAQSLAEALGVSPGRALRIAEGMRRSGLVRITPEGRAVLTDKGRELATHVLRAHRLWERYLADEARLPLAHLHKEAHRAEHMLSPEDVDALDAHLGHPDSDPHGDPIPGSSGVESTSLGTPLTEWKPGRPAVVAHIEDEPAAAYGEVSSLGIKPGDRVTVIGRDATSLRLRDHSGEAILSRWAATGVHVRPFEAGSATEGQLIRLSELRHGQQGRVERIDSACRGFTRRRLLDLGLTTGAAVKAELRNAMGDPRGFRVRGTLIALRKEQADLVWISRDAPDATEKRRG